MIFNMTSGGSGSAALNFKVVGGNSAPSNPTENTIWVNTDVPIGKWYFDASQPDDLQEGDVWFPVGTSSSVEFNALKKNSIQVYPTSAKQYVDGELVDVEAKIYQGGEWVDWVIYLISDSKLNTTYAGAWNKTTGSQGVGGSATMTSEGLLITANKGNDTYGTQLRYGPDETIDFNNINTIEFIVSNKSGSSALCAWVTPVFATSYNSTSVASIGQGITTTNQIISMDVSDVNGEYYLRVGTSTSKNNSAFSYVIHSLILK